MKWGRFRYVTLSLALLLTVAASASAAITSLGGALPDRPGNWNAVAFDSVNQVYLVAVASEPITAKFVNKDGVAITGAFGISSANEGYSGWTSVAFGGTAQDPVFLVTYTLNWGGTALTHSRYGRLVRYNNASPTVSGRIYITEVRSQWNYSERNQSAWTGSAWVVGTQVEGAAYNMPFATAEVHTIDTAGNVSAGHLLGDPEHPDYYGAPSIACKTDGSVCMAMGFAGGIDFGGGGVATYARLFDGHTLANVTGAFYIDNHVSNQQNHHVVYNDKTNEFLAVWWRAGYIDTRTVSPAGAMGTLNEKVMNCPPCGASGAFAGDLNVAYNSATGTTLLAAKQYPADLYVFEIDDNGTQLAGPLLVSTWDLQWPEYDPSIAADPVNGRWFVVAAETTGRALLVQGNGTPRVSPPAITLHPSNTTIGAHSFIPVTLTAAASGQPVPTVKWQMMKVGGATWTDIAGATSATYSFWAAPRDRNRLFRAVFTNSEGTATTVGARLSITGITSADYDGDGLSDVLVWRASTGTWYWSTSSSGYNDGGSKQFGSAALGDRALNGDIDGDGRPDAIVWRASTGTFYWSTSSTGFSNGGSRQWGNQGLGDQPLLADFDGDGRADLAVWRATTGTWYWLTSSSGYTDGSSQQFGSGAFGDQPIVGDFDGDGKDDIAVWRSSTGMWYWLTSSTGFTSGFQLQFGSGGLGDQPFLGDFDGDGRADITVWRSTTGTWYWANSSANYTSGGSKQWGNLSLGDVPKLADVDGDGKSDPLVWRAPTGTWYWTTSSSNYAGGGSVQFGSGGLGDLAIIK